MTNLPNDIARCAGVGSDSEGWREGCDHCLRRMSEPPADAVQVTHMEPPAVIGFFCPNLIEELS